MIVASLIAILCVSARLIPALCWPSFAGSDLYFHLSYADLIRRSGHRLPQRNDRIAGPGQNSYPALFHRLLSYLPDRAVGLLQSVGGIFLDAAPAAGASIALYKYAAVPASQVVILSAVYLLAPTLVLVDIGPGTHTLSPRWFGRSLYASGLLALLAYEASHVPVELLLACLLFALSLLTSKFAVQALLLILPLSAAITLSWLPVAVVMLSMGLALILSGGFFIRQLRGQALHLEWYIRRQAAFIYKQARLRPLLRLIGRGEWVAAAEEAFVRNPILSGLSRNALLVAGLVWYEFARPRYARLAHSPLSLAAAVCLSATGIWILTSFGLFRVLGEPERYVQFAMPAAWVLFWSLPSGHARPRLIVMVTIISVAAWAISVAAENIYTKQRGLSDFEAVLDLIGRQESPVVLSIDTSESYAFLSRSGVRVCTYNGQESLRDDLAGFLDLLLWRYPWIHGGHLSTIVKQFGVTHISARKAALAQVEALGGPAYDLSPYSKVCDNPYYAVYSVGES